jgi:pSer/pThr/pTyr-binding forkhead associated (FHA) protein
MPQLIASIDGVETRRVSLLKDKTTLGRRPNNDIVLDDRVVSGTHCVFHLKGLVDVFVEDLGSTNGTYVNDHMVKYQQLRDGDLITIGRYRVQYLAETESPSSQFGSSSFGNLEPSNNSVGTQAMPLEGYGARGPGTPMHASMRILTGTSAGLEVPVVKAVSTFGKPGEAVVAIAHRRQGYFVSCLEAKTQPKLNGIALRNDPVMLNDGDVIELLSTQMEFKLVV